MALKFPSKYEKGMPFVTFFPRKYSFPKSDGRKAEYTKDNPGNIETISLYLPGDYSEQLQSKWGPQEILGGANSGILGMAESEALQAAKAAIGNKISGTVSARSGQIAAPIDLNIYQGPEPISLNFSFDLIPYNQAEGNIIVNIISNFKKATIPSMKVDSDILILDYPAVWDIEFSGINSIGYKNKSYLDMALTQVQVGFNSGMANMATYKDGNPVQVKLTLGFQAIRKFYTVQGEDVK